MLDSLLKVISLDLENKVCKSFAELELLTHRKVVQLRNKLFHGSWIESKISYVKTQQPSKVQKKSSTMESLEYLMTTN